MSRHSRDPDLEQLSRPRRADVRRLGSTLGQVLVETGGAELLDDVERLRKAAIQLRESRGAAASERLARVVEVVDGLDPKRAEAVARAFTVYFQLVNLAEERHRVRILRQRGRAGAPVAESLAATVAELRGQLGEEGLGGLMEGLEIRPVLTAHPTEARSRAVVDALRRIARVLDVLDDDRLAATEHAEAERQLSEQVSILWRTSLVQRQQPAPLDEVRSVMSVFDESLFPLVPVLYRELERALGAGPEERPYLRWGSWVGGDRDGNPAVTHGVTEAALQVQTEHVLAALEAAARRIGRWLTLSAESTPPTDDLRRLLEEGRAALGDGAGETGAQPGERPYGAALVLAAERLRATRLGIAGAYPSASAFVADLGTVQEALRAAGAVRVADGELQHLLWQARTFGFHGASLEVRQHSAVHRAVLAELLPGCDVDAPALDALAAGAPAPAPGASRGSETARELVATFQAMARLQERHGAKACRRYVVSFTRSPADVVAVTALARLAVPDGRLELDVVPLFESRADLEAAPDVLDGLLALPGWRSWLDRRGRRLEVMLGYSDATKDAGYLAANLALYRAQGALVGWARRNQAELTIFHGRGGAVGRDRKSGV